MDFAKCLKKYLRRKSFLVKMQPFRNLYFKEHFVVTASARIFYKSRVTTCVYFSLWFLFGESLIYPNQLTLIGVSISSYSYICSSRMNDTVREWKSFFLHFLSIDMDMSLFPKKIKTSLFSKVFSLQNSQCFLLYKNK